MIGTDTQKITCNMAGSIRKPIAAGAQCPMTAAVFPSGAVGQEPDFLPPLRPAGALLLLDMAPGRYIIVAPYKRQLKSRKIVVKARKHNEFVFVWKEEETE